MVNPASPFNRDFILKQIKISYDLHGARKVILMHHTDCGAYGGHKAFDSELEEEQKHLRDMEEAARTIESQWPGIEVAMVLIKMTAKGNEFVEIR